MRIRSKLGYQQHTWRRVDSPAISKQTMMISTAQQMTHTAQMVPLDTAVHSQGSTASDSMKAV
jgi:hypothetical protein